MEILMALKFRSVNKDRVEYKKQKHINFDSVTAVGGLMKFSSERLDQPMRSTHASKLEITILRLS